MDEFIIIGLIALAIPVSIIILFFMHFSQKNQLGKLRQRLAKLEMGAAPVAEATADKAKVVTKPATTQDAPWKPKKSEPAAKPASPTSKAEPVADSTTPPPAYVFRKEKMDKFAEWMKENWFFAVAALSLALAGVFFVQYGIENGYLTPFWRVMGALSLGAALIGAGEWIRRRGGDEDGAHTAYLPSTFSGAGLVALFAGVLAARQLYGLIGPEMALIGLVAVSGIAVVLGWFHGPLLAVVGILGATVAPFLVGGSSDTPQLYFYYFALILVAGVLVDAIKRWAWVSVFSLIFSFSAAFMIFVQGAGDAHFLAFALIAMVAAVTLPPLQIWPAHQGEMVSISLYKSGKSTPVWPEFPTRLASGSFVAAILVVLVVGIKDSGTAEIWLVLMALAALFVAAVAWFRKAPALMDLALLPPVAFLGILLAQSEGWGSIFRVFRAGAQRLPETAPPWDVTVICALALAGSALAFWRGMRAVEYRLVWAGGAALLAPLTVLTLEVFWRPLPVLGAGLWAWHAMAVALVMTLFTVQIARVDGADRRRAAIFALSAMTMISFALVVMLSSVALTVALAVMVLLAAWIDRKLDMRLLSVFVQVGGVVAGWRLIIDPGVDWATSAPLWEIIFGYGTVIALFAAAWLVLRIRDRIAAIIVMESAVWTLSGVFASVLLFRAIEDASEGHWTVSLMALIWLISAANQLYRMQIGGHLKRVRIVLAGAFGAIGMFGLGIAVFGLNPLFSWNEVVHGPLVFDTLLVAYALPAALFGFAAWRFTHLLRWLRISLATVASLLAALYLALEIRRFWHGDVLAGGGTSDGELYSYTVAMLLVSVALLFYAFSRRSTALRKIAVIGIGLTIAKVFLIDMSGLAGLIRVASFLGLGLSLAGLAWVNKRMSAQWDEKSG